MVVITLFMVVIQQPAVVCVEIYNSEGFTFE